uniref:Ig-like domain-containing protein n=1 Tax=Gopherus evgoodei TaxID=1825980 RepID=A0A8C4WND9_9SAUR
SEVGLLILYPVSIFLGDLPLFRLVEFGPAMVRPPETLQLNCAVYGSYITGGGTLWYWSKQSPRKGLEWMGLIDSEGDTAYTPSFQSRIIISRDTSKNQFYFQLRSLTTADTATYYCARETQCSLPSFFSYSNLWGKGFVSLSTSLCMKFSPLPQPAHCKSPNAALKMRPWG